MPEVSRFDRADFKSILKIAKRDELFVRHLGHMRQRKDDGRLGFVLGAGASEQAGVPLWKELIRRLFEHYGEDGPPAIYKDGNYPATLVAQYIYNRFHTNRCKTIKSDGHDPRMVSVAVRNAWYRLIHEAIYKEVADLETVRSSHPYMLELAHLVYAAPFCLTLNFDDILDRICQSLKGFYGDRQAPNVIWRPPLVDRPNAGVIYHVNGFLPQNAGAKSSESIVLTEDSFASLIASPSPVDTEYLMARVTGNTMAVFGASFDDPSLRNLFYAAGQRNPAGFHYCFLLDESVADSEISDPERHDRRELNRSMYNIVTYFVTKAEVSAIIRMLCLTGDEFVQWLNELAGEIGTHTVQRYYVVGPVSSGKSSLIERLRNFKTYEEWNEPPLALMFRDPKSLSAEESAVVDDWVLRQLAIKDQLMRTPNYGIHVMDRAPLDMFAFPADKAVSASEINRVKAEALHKRLNRTPVQGGEIIFLEAEKKVLFERQVRRGRGPEWLEKSAYRQGALQEQKEALKEIYSPDLTEDTTYLSQDEVARQVAERILFSEYKPSNLEDIRVEIARAKEGANEA